MPHRQSWFHGTYDKLTNTLSYVLLCHFHLQLPDNRHKWHTHTNPPPVTSVVEPSLPQASNPTRQQCHGNKWGTVHLRPEPIIAPQPWSPSNHCPAAAGGKGPEPVPHTPLMDSPRAGRGSQSLATNTTKQTQWLTVGLEPGFSGPSLTEQNHCSNPALDIATATETRWLGFTVTEDLRLRRHCELRLKAAKVAHRQFMDMGVWQMGVSYGQAVILWKTLVLPRLLYGVEVLAVLGEAWPEADVFVKNCVSEVLQLPRRSPTTALVGELGVRPLKIELLRRKLRWYAQSMRNPVEEVQPGVDSTSDINIAAWCCTGVLGKKADVDTGDSFPRKTLLELQGLECAGGRLPAWIHGLKRDVVTASALAWSGDYCAFQHEKEFLGSIEDGINARTLEYISSGAASYAEVYGMSDRIVKPCFRVYRVLRKPHGKILWSCRTQTLGLLGEVNRAGGGSSAARERCRLCGMGVETLHHLLFECRCEGLSDTKPRLAVGYGMNIFFC